MEITEFEKKRAANLIWSAAQNYEIRPAFRVYDEEGRADLYWNCIVGSVCLHYEWDKLQAFYTTFRDTMNQGLYENLFWIALENAAFGKEEHVRPVFPYLRKEYAERKLAVLHPGLEQSRADWILQGHLRHALGRDSGLPDPVDRKLLKAIEIGPEADTEALIDSLRRTLEEYFGYTPNDPNSFLNRKTIRTFSLALLLQRGKRKEDRGPVRHFAFGFGEHTEEEGGAVVDQSHLSVSFAKYSQQTDEGLREYIYTYFGKPIYERRKVEKIEKDCCFGNHRDVHLHFTRGETTPEMLEKGGFAVEQRRAAIAQEKTNAAAYEADSARNRVTIERLAARIRNSILTHLENQEVKSSGGKLMADRIWRGLYLDDSKIFRKELRGDAGNITVDILLDASTSQIHRQETVSAQGYMIAEALTRCGIPVRVSSFSSLNGYTVMTLFRDYGEVRGNRNIFRYFTSGANRDGLAVRITAGMVAGNHAEHRLLIVLSDCKPNDAIKMRSSGGDYIDYSDRNAVEDTAAEVHQARMNGISVMCVFTGGDEALPAVHRIYDRNFVRIRSLNMFADAVGGLLQNQIRAI
jgi:hypothetical protein